MYGKSFETKFEGSMVGAGFHVYAVWDYCITKNRSGFVELNPKLLAFVLDGGRDGSEQKVEEAIAYLTKDDPKSRSPESEGRRLVKEGQFQYRMVNWAEYEGIKSIADLREYNRRKQAEYRERKRVKEGRKRGWKKGAGRDSSLPGSHQYEQAERNGESQEKLDAITTGHLPQELQ